MSAEATGLRILAGGLPGFASPIDPAGLSAAHPSWAADVAALGPWRLEPGACWSPAKRSDRSVVVCGPCASTMDVARELVARRELGPWGSVLAPVQTSGRGQLRRHWLSAPGNLMVTLVCPEAPPPWNDLRPLLLGHLLAEALEELSIAVRIKWPNDLLLDGRKIGGMLVEERPGCVLAGIGLNLAWAPAEESLREGSSLAAATFPELSGLGGPLGLWLRLEKRLETGYRTLLETFSSTEFLSVFQCRLAWLGRRVLVDEGPGVRFEARIRGVSAQGELVLDRDGREVLLQAGDVRPV